MVRAGLWEESESVSGEGLAVSAAGVVRLAEEQSVVGLVVAGLEKLPTGIVPLTEKLTLLGKCQMIEQQNMTMNQFVAQLMAQMREVGISVVLLKGLGIAQCYERPLWRASGDVDLLLDEVNYEKAKSFLLPKSTTVEKEFKYNKHQALTIGQYTVELHGNLRCGLSKKIDMALDEIKDDVLKGGTFRKWQNGNTEVLLPSADDDVVYVFTHILNHFYKGGIGLRQICDWCRLLWVYRDTIDVALLERRLRKMKLVSEWKAFGVFTVEKLGMPMDAMPLYESSDKVSRKANLILDFLFKSGNFGHNRDMSYYSKYHYFLRKMISLKQRLGDLLNHARIFPINTLRFTPVIMYHGLRSAAKGE